MRTYSCVVVSACHFLRYRLSHAHKFMVLQRPSTRYEHIWTRARPHTSDMPYVGPLRELESHHVGCCIYSGGQRCQRPTFVLTWQPRPCHITRSEPLYSRASVHPLPTQLSPHLHRSIPARGAVVAEEAELDPAVDALVAIAIATFCSRTVFCAALNNF